MMPSTSEASTRRSLQTRHLQRRQHYLRALIEMISILLSRLMMDELAAAGTFDKLLSAVTTGTEWMKGRKVGRSWYTQRHVQTDHRRWQMEWRGEDCKKDRRSICSIDNMVSASHWGDVTGWQVGCCCLCHWLWDQGWHAEIPANPDSRFWSLWLQLRPQWHVNPQWHAHTYTHICAHTLSAGVKLHRLLLITATVPAFGARAPNYTAQPQQGRCAQQSFVRLIICLGLVIAVRTGTQVIVW